MEVVKRRAVRAVLMAAEGEVLLIRLGNPGERWSGWIAPGGGLDDGESELGGLTRELREELGFEIESETETPAVKVWRRFHRFSWGGKIIEQDEVFFLVRTAKFSLRRSVALTETEMTDFQEMRWWSVEEMESSKENFAPTEFAKYLRKLREEGVPLEPLDVGV